MSTSYTSYLGLALPVQGELSGSWGNEVNNYITTYLDAAVAGAQTVTTDTTLTKTTGTSLGSTSSQYAIIIASPASANITITAPAASKIYTIINTSATYTVKIVGAGPTTGVTLGVSEKAQVAWNGSDFVRIGASGGPGVFSSITNTGLTSGRVVFSSTGGLEADSANLVWDNTNAYLGIGTSSPANKLHVSNGAVAPTTAIVRIDTTATTAYSDTAFVGGQLRLNYGNATSSYGGINFSNFGATSQEFFGVVQNSSGYGSFVWQGYNGSAYAERMRLDSSGNLGLGVTPSAWNTAAKAYTNAAGSFYNIGTTIAGIIQNAYLDSGGIYKYVNTGEASYFAQSAGIFTWASVASGSGGATAGLTEKMRLDSGGRLLVGTSTSNGSAIIQIGGLTTSSTNADFFIGRTGASETATAGNGASIQLQNLTNNTACIIQQYSNNLQFFNYTGSGWTERMRLDSSGNLLIGGTTQYGAAKLTITSGGAYIALNSTTGGYSLVRGFDNGTERWSIGQAAFGGADGMAFYTGSSTTERMRLDASGNLLVGTTTAYAKTVSVSSDGVLSGVVGINDIAGVGCVDSWNRATSGNNTFSVFGTETSYTARGSITYNRAGGLVVYNTTSDYRAKDIIGPVQNSGATIDSLKVYEGQMKGATQSRPMLVAHEAQAVTPYAVTGEKDAVKKDGTPEYQQMDVSSLVPLLIAEIQSLRIRIAQLEAK